MSAGDERGVARCRFPARRLQVYRNNVVESLTGALLAVYPGLKNWFGRLFFRYAVHEYLRARAGRAAAPA